MLTKITFNKAATALFMADDRKVRLKIQDGIAFLKPTHRPHNVKAEWLSHVRVGDGAGVAVFRGHIIKEGHYQMIPSAYGWLTLVPGYSEDDFGCLTTMEDVKFHEVVE